MDRDSVHFRYNNSSNYCCFNNIFTGKRYKHGYAYAYNKLCDIHNCWNDYDKVILGHYI